MVLQSVDKLRESDEVITIQGYENVTCAFLNEFKEEYKRSNRTKGQKIIRCFPSCSSKGHRNNGFCGVPLEVVIRNLPKVEDVAKLMVWAQIQQGASDEQSTQEVWCVGDIVTKTKFDSMVRSERDWSKEIIPGKVMRTDGEIYCIFNDEHVSWNYNWTSNRHTSETSHQIVVYLAREVEKGQHRVIVVSKSPGFRIFSRNRGNRNTEDDGGDYMEIDSVDSQSTKTRGNNKFNNASKVTNNTNSNMMAISKYVNSNSGTTIQGMNNQLPAQWMSSYFAQTRPAIPNSDVPLLRTLREIQYNRLKDRLLLLVFTVSSISHQVYDSTVTEYIYPMDVQVYPNTGMNYVSSILTSMFLENGLSNAAQISDLIVSITSRAVAMIYEGQYVSMLMGRLTSPEHLVRMRDWIYQEADPNFEWSTLREDESFNMNKISEKSVFAEFRNMFREVMAQAIELEAAGHEMELQNAMQIVSASGLLTHDPFRPPDISEAQYVYFQVHQKNIPKMDTYSAGHKSFTSEGAQQEYGRDLLLVRRGIYRSYFLNHLNTKLRYTGLTNAVLIPGVFYHRGNVENSNVPEEPIVLSHGPVLFHFHNDEKVSSIVEIRLTNTLFEIKCLSESCRVPETYPIDGQEHLMPLRSVQSHFVPSLENPPLQRFFVADFQHNSLCPVVIAFDTGVDLAFAYVVSRYPNVCTNHHPNTMYRLIVIVRVMYDKPNILAVEEHDYLFPTHEIPSLKQPANAWFDLESNTGRFVSRKTYRYVRALVDSDKLHDAKYFDVIADAIARGRSTEKDQPLL